MSEIWWNVDEIVPEGIITLCGCTELMALLVLLLLCFVYTYKTSWSCCAFIEL